MNFRDSFSAIRKLKMSRRLNCILTFYFSTHVFAMLLVTPWVRCRQILDQVFRKSSMRRWVHLAVEIDSVSWSSYCITRVIGQSQYRLGIPGGIPYRSSVFWVCCNALWGQLTCWNSPQFFWGHWQTVSLHSPNGRQLPAIRAVQGDCEIVYGFMSKMAV